MCGRYTMTGNLDQLVEVFGAPPLEGIDLGLPRYNVAPTQDAPVVAEGSEGRRTALFRWGLVPFWADDPSIGNRMINARSETVGEKPAFRNAFKRHRCLVVTDGFYEWQRPPDGEGPKRPFWIHRADERPFAMAGIWERWGDKDDPLLSFAILTRAAPDWMKPLHHRMPVLLGADVWDPWLDPESGPDDLEAVLARADLEPLETREVSTLVNKPSNDVPECISPVAG